MLHCVVITSAVRTHWRLMSSDWLVVVSVCVFWFRMVNELLLVTYCAVLIKSCRARLSLCIDLSAY